MEIWSDDPIIFASRSPTSPMARPVGARSLRIGDKTVIRLRFKQGLGWTAPEAKSGRGKPGRTFASQPRADAG